MAGGVDATGDRVAGVALWVLVVVVLEPVLAWSDKMDHLLESRTALQRSLE
jgi:hypothetical protein